MSEPHPLQIFPVEEGDRAWMRQSLLERWGAIRVVSRGKLYEDVSQLPGLIALHGDECVGLLTYHIAGDQCEVVTLDAFTEGIGAASALMSAAREVAREAGCQRLWLITTNDNTHALRFYQRWGMRITAIHINALDISRRIKPEIPLVGMDGIPLRDEIELEVAP